VLDWTLENLTAHDVARLRSIYEPLTESVRALVDATIGTEVGAETVAAAKAEIDAATARLRTEQLDGSYGVRFSTDGDQMPWGNVVIGVTKSGGTAVGDRAERRPRRVHRLPSRRGLRRSARTRPWGSRGPGARPRPRRSGQ